MGRAGIRRRKRARHLPKVAPQDARTIEQSPYSYEGAIEAIGLFGRGTKRLPVAQARVLRLLLAIILAAIVVSVIVWIAA